MTPCCRNTIGGGGASNVVLRAQHISSAITAQYQVACAVAGQWYVVNANYVAVSALDFTITSGGLITYTGGSSNVFNINGVSSVGVDRPCTITLGSRFNGIDQPGGIPRTFLAQAPSGAIGQAGGQSLDPGDNFLAIIKSSVANTTVTFQTLFGAFYGVSIQ